jgi:hypothetical protein
MVVSQLITIALTLIWLALSILPYLFWDAPNASGTLQFSILGCMWLSPIIPIGLSIAAWIAYARRKNWLAAVLSAITSVPPLLLAILFAILSLSSLVALPSR